MCCYRRLNTFDARALCRHVLAVTSQVLKIITNNLST